VVGGYAERHHVSDPHYYVPGRYLDAFGRECFPEFSLGVFRVDLSQALSLIVIQKYRQQNIFALVGHSLRSPVFACESKNLSNKTNNAVARGNMARLLRCWRYLTLLGPSGLPFT
jgi:hypothetical protein